MYHFLRKNAFFLFKILFEVEIKGIENIPKEGSVIIASNHISNFDPLFVAFPVERQIRFMAKKEIFNFPFIGKLVKSLGSFPVNRGGGDREAIRTSLEILRNNEILGIFPEGTRNKSGTLGKGHTGVGIFALKSKAVVIPVGIKSSFKLFSTVEISYGNPVNLTHLYKERQSTEDVNEATKLIMDSIRKVLK